MKIRIRFVAAGMVAMACLATSAHAGGVVAPGDVKIVDGMVKESISGEPGNADNGKKVFASRKLGNCLACHVVPDQDDQLFQGDVGPNLTGVADRWTPEELRAIVVNSKKSLNEDSIMPGFYSLDVGINVRKDLVGKTILSAQDVEDVVAYISTLKQQ